MNDYVFVFNTSEYDSDDDVTMLPPPPVKKTDLRHVVVSLIGLVANTICVIKSIV